MRGILPEQLYGCSISSWTLSKHCLYESFYLCFLIASADLDGWSIKSWLFVSFCDKFAGRLHFKRAKVLPSALVHWTLLLVRFAASCPSWSLWAVGCDRLVCCRRPAYVLYCMSQVLQAYIPSALGGGWVQRLICCFFCATDLEERSDWHDGQNMQSSLEETVEYPGDVAESLPEKPSDFRGFLWLFGAI